MKREELIQSKEYLLAKLQIDLFNEVAAYIKANDLNRTKFAEKLGVSKGYVSQILNGDADHRMSKFIELSLAINLVPTVSFEKIEDFLHRENAGYNNISYHDIERSKDILSNSGYLLSDRPVNRCGEAKSQDDVKWTVLSANNENSEKQYAS